MRYDNIFEVLRSMQREEQVPGPIVQQGIERWLGGCSKTMLEKEAKARSYSPVGCDKGLTL
jgi:hypothetical protein